VHYKYNGRNEGNSLFVHICDCHYYLVAKLNNLLYLCMYKRIIMTKAEKLLARFLSRPKDFTYNELLRLLSSLGYKVLHGSGSRVVFRNESFKHQIKLHPPHPGTILRIYQIDLIIQELKSNGLL
jgi:predicted RNA binding protein YcfA (HicA-like mRNA interferase family)